MTHTSIRGLIAPSRWFPPAVKQRIGHLAHAPHRLSPMQSASDNQTPAACTIHQMRQSFQDPAYGFRRFVDTHITNRGGAAAARRGRPGGGSGTGGAPPREPPGGVGGCAAARTWRRARRKEEPSSRARATARFAGAKGAPAAEGTPSAPSKWMQPEGRAPAAGLASAAGACGRWDAPFPRGVEAPLRAHGFRSATRKEPKSAPWAQRRCHDPED